MNYIRLYPLILVTLLLTALWQQSISPSQAEGRNPPLPLYSTSNPAKPSLIPPCQFVYPIIIHESQVPTTSGTLIPDILYGAYDHGISSGSNDKGFLAWDPNQTLIVATLAEEFRSPELSIIDYQNALNPSDIELSVSDHVRSLPGNNGGVNDNSDPLLDNLVGQDIIIPVWDTFDIALEAYRISGFIRVRMTRTAAQGGIDLASNDPKIEALYLGPVDLSQCSILTLTKQGPLTATTGSPITYTITVSNSGTITATNLLITDVLPVGANYVAGGSLAGDVISWTVSSLAHSQSLTRTFTVTSTQTITNNLYGIRFQTYLTGTEPYSATGQVSVVTVVVEPAPLLTITKRAPVTATAGSPITYTLVVTNSGDLTATNLVITDALPAGTNYLNGGSLVGNIVSWTVTSLANGQSLTRTFSVTASETITNSHYRVSAAEGISATGQVKVTTIVTQKKIRWFYLPLITK